MTDLDAVDTETLAAACRTAAVSSAHADLLNAVAARMLAMLSWIDGAKVDMAAMEEERAKALAAVALAGEEIERASVEVKRARVLIRSLVGTTPFPQPAPCPCATVAALDVRPDPSATTDGGAS